MTIKKFSDYKLSDELLKSIDLLGFKCPTEVQAKVIPSILEHGDVLVKSQTGSGKTASYAIPICELVNWEENKPQALILAPTRELAIQIKEDIFHIGRFKRIKVPVLYGRTTIAKQVKELKQKTHIVVGTPGRVMDHIIRGSLITDEIRYLVIDEADEMLNMGFLDEVEDILDKLPENRITMLFSATLPNWIASIAKTYMKDPIRIEFKEQSVAAENIQQELYFVEETDKLSLLKKVTMIENPDTCLIFCNTQQKVEQIYRELNKDHYPCNKIHGGMLQDDRTKVMADFKKGQFRYLVATDVAARGIDIDNITIVINFDVPEGCEIYVHRIGRTGRQEKAGLAKTFITPRDSSFPDEISRFTGQELIRKSIPNDDEIIMARRDFEEKLQKQPKYKEDKGAKLNEEILRIHINAGKKTKMRPVDIVGTLCSIEGVNAEDIGVISVLDISTFVEILNNKGEMVLSKLQDRNIKGRPRKVSRAEPKQ
ncbi:MAG TPA: DEAD/DEAH box helicase [Anaerovoracaceae bacterium]|nr:DEAD/DEAH box helicase [Anaerovoracaceae bacterium]